MEIRHSLKEIMKYLNISEVLHILETTVKTYFWRAKRMLREELIKQVGEEWCSSF